MGLARGAESRAGAAVASTWGTAVALGAGHELLFNEESIKFGVEDADDQVAGSVFSQGSSVTSWSAAGGLVADLRYESNLETLVALVFGDETDPVQQGSTAAYLHKLHLADNLRGLFGTLAFFVPYGASSHHVKELTSAKVQSATFSGEGNGVVRAALELIGAPDLASTTNTSPSGLTFANEQHRVLMRQGVFKINPQGDGDVDLTSPVDFSKFEIAVKRPMTDGKVAGSSGKIAEPYDDGFPEITLRLTLPNWNDNTWDAAFAAETVQKATLKFTGPLIEDTYNYYVSWAFPQLKLVSEPPSVGGPGNIAQELTFKAQKADQAPTGMSGVTLPVEMRYMNKRTGGFFS